jgi:hypothetical protein
MIQYCLIVLLSYYIDDTILKFILMFISLSLVIFIYMRSSELTCEFQFKFLLVFMNGCEVQQSFTLKFIVFNSAVFPGFFI